MKNRSTFVVSTRCLSSDEVHNYTSSHFTCWRIFIFDVSFLWQQCKYWLGAPSEVNRPQQKGATVHMPFQSHLHDKIFSHQLRPISSLFLLFISRAFIRWRRLRSCFKIRHVAFMMMASGAFRWWNGGASEAILRSSLRVIDVLCILVLCSCVATAYISS